jgi:RNA polymerase sigma factor (sigma-70 family)
MASGPLGVVMQRIRRLVRAPVGENHTDGHLLQRFATHRDESAFASLLQRHGPLVFGVCRRVLGDEHDAEDAFQATFLVLARKASSLDGRGSVTNWLYTVAYHLALRARTDAVRRREQERRAATMPATEASDDVVWRDLRPVLDEELNRLPEKYRSPVLLCYLEGKTQEEAAALLGWTKGTVSGRLARARDLLRGRLTRRGLALSAGSLSALLAGNASAAVPSLLQKTTLDAALLFAAGQTASGAAVGLAQAALHATALTKGKIVAAFLLVVVVTTAGAGVLVSRMPSAPPPEQPKADEPKPMAARVDAHGDLLPPGALARLGTIRLCQGETTGATAFSPDGKILAVGGSSVRDKGTIRLWDTSTGQETQRLVESANDPSRLAFSPDGRSLASISGGTLRLWEVSTGQPFWSWTFLDESPPQPPNAKDDPLHDVAFSPDGQTLAVAAGDETIRFRATATGKELRRLKDDASSLAFSPNGKTLAAYHTKKKSVSLWDLDADKRLHTLMQPSTIRSIAFSPDGLSLAVHVSWKEYYRTPPDDKIILWNVLEGKELRQLNGHEFYEHIQFAPDGKSLLAGKRSFDLATGKMSWRVGGSVARLYGQALSPDGRILLSAWCGTLRLWDLVAERELVPLDRHEAPIQYVIPSPDGKTIRTVAGSDQTVREWDAATGKQIRSTSVRSWLSYSALSADGKTLAIPPERRDRDYSLFDLESGEITREDGDQHGNNWAVALSADGKLLASSWDQQQVARVWDTRKGIERCKLEAETLRLSSLAFSPDGKQLAAAFALEDIRLYDAATGKLLDGPAWEAKQRAKLFEKSIAPRFVDSESVECDPNTALWPVAGLLFSPDGKSLAVMGGFHRNRHPLVEKPDAGLVRVYDVATRKERFQLVLQEAVAAFSPDSKTLATGCHHDYAVYLRDAVSGKQLARLDGHRGAITALAFAADGRTLISGSADSTALVWDVSGR